MAFKTHINDATGNQPGQTTTFLTAALSEGVHNLARTDFKVTGTAGLGVVVAKGEAFVHNDSYVYGTMDQKFFSVASSGTVSASIASNSSGNPRIDVVCLKVDTAATPGVQGVASSSIVVIQGTASATPAVPTIPNNHLALANIAVANGASVISNAEITDKRVQATTGMISGPEGFLVNGRIVPSVSSNNLTVAIKTLAGNDPSEGEPVWCRIGSNLVKITAALSVTKNAGTKWCNAGSSELATNEVDYFVYLGYNATDGVTIGFSRIPYARAYSDFSTTTTNEKYCAISTITNAASTDPYVVVGRFAATLSAGAGYTWSVPTFTAINLISAPIFETRWLTWAPTITGFSSAPTSGLYNYRLTNTNVEIILIQPNNGTSNATTFTISLPLTVVTLTNYDVYTLGQITDNGTNPTAPGLINTYSAQSVLYIYKDIAGGAFTATNAKKVKSGYLAYRII